MSQELEQKVKDLQLSLDESESLRSKSQSDLEASEKALEKATADLDAALKVNESLSALFEKRGDAPKSEEAKPVDISTINLADFSFEYKKKKYGFNFYKIQHDGVAITAAEIAVDANLQKHMVESGNGIIKNL